MARTKADLEKELELVRYNFEELFKENLNLREEIEQIKTNKDVVSKVEYEILLNLIKNTELQRDSYKKMFEKEKEKNVELRNRKIYRVGRKEKVTPEEIKELQEQGYKKKEIAEELNISLSSVRKGWITKKQREGQPNEK